MALARIYHKSVVPVFRHAQHDVVRHHRIHLRYNVHTASFGLIRSNAAETLTNRARTVGYHRLLAELTSTNIGNSFFQLGAQWLLKQASPNANVFLIGDEPGYWNVKRGNPENALDYAAHVEIDALVVQGPAFRRETRGILSNVLKAHHERGAKIIVLAAGMMSYDDSTVHIARSILSETPPYLFTTRDSETYELLGDLAEHAYDGIDVATFVSDLFPPVPTDLPPYVVLNFDQIPEPRFSRRRDAKLRSGDVLFEWDNNEWIARQPRLRTELSYKSRAYPFFESLLPHRQASSKFGQYGIVRTDHRYNPFLPRKSYARPNTYVGDIPYSYLNIYANAQCTISNRVHACVATASYGNPAMLFTRSPRAFLLNRLGLHAVKDKPTTLDLSFLRDEKQKLIDYLSDKLQSL